MITQSPNTANIVPPMLAQKKKQVKLMWTTKKRELMQLKQT